MAKWHPIEIDDITEPPPHTEHLAQLRNSAEDLLVLARVNAYLVPSAPTERMATGEADTAEEAMYANLAFLGEAIPKGIALMKLHLSNSEEARLFHRLLDDIYRSYMSTREAFEEADDAAWAKYGDA